MQAETQTPAPALEIDKKKILKLTPDAIQKNYIIADCCKPIPGDDVLGYIDEDLQFNDGIYVASVNANSAASIAGIRRGDIILSIDGNKLEKMCELRCYIYSKKPGDKVTLEVQRNFRTIEVEATLKRK